MALLETKETGKIEALVTHYYQCPLSKLQDALIKACNILELEVLSIDDTYHEILFASNNLEFTAKLDMYQMLSYFDVAVNVGLFSRKKAILILEKIHNTLKKDLIFKGLGKQK